jgi:putative SOS response-associated peptidase YedK
MCYHLSIHSGKQKIANQFHLTFLPEKKEKIRYHVNAFDFPEVDLILQDTPSVLSSAYWGLIPSFAKSESEAVTLKNNTINAKGETLFARASFKDSIQSRKCVVLVDGFFEWQKQGKFKIPHYVFSKDKAPLALAGITNTWRNPETSEIINTFSIITKEANELMASIHNTKKRMPAILEQNEINDWLSATDKNKINAFLKPNEHSNLMAHSVNLDLKLNGEKNPKVILPHKHLSSDQQSLFEYD